MVNDRKGLSRRAKSPASTDYKSRFRKKRDKPMLKGRLGPSVSTLKLFMMLLCLICSGYSQVGFDYCNTAADWQFSYQITTSGDYMPTKDPSNSCLTVTNGIVDDPYGANGETITS